VNGFDRSSSGNTFNFIRQHAAAVVKAGVSFESATNDAVIKGLFNLEDYPVVDYILGEESTVDETFSASEQPLLASFLKQGGRLFVTGAEIAWDLDYKGSSGDKSFFHTYLKAAYSADAPGDVSGKNYAAEGVEGGLYGNITTISFDNGTHGTYNVRYADALTPRNGGKSIVTYKGVTDHKIGGVSFEGLFEGGEKAGKLVYLGFPFETVYPESTRDEMMQATLDFLYRDLSAFDEKPAELPAEYVLHQNFPNPFNPSTTIRYRLATYSDVEIAIYNMLGEKVWEWHSPGQHPGRHTLVWDGRDKSGKRVSSGQYVYKIRAGGFEEVKKMILMR
jgi:hypothetical protein